MLKVILLVWFFFGLLLCINLAVARVRTVYLNDKKMEQITLNMGRSTVLRFMEKPKKVIIGNKNYFNIEFIGNDITIQPQGTVSTNLFVYCEDNTYGFVINVTNNGYCDDLVKIKWKSKASRFFRRSKKVKKIIKPKKVGLMAQIDGVFKILIDSIWKNEKRNLYLMDIILKNETKKSIKLKEIKFNLKRKDKRISKQFYVCKHEEVKPNKTVKIRFFIRFEKKDSFTLDINYRDNKKSIKIQRKYL